MSLKFGDLDEGMQRSVFAAISILCILLCISLIKFVHYVFIGVTLLASLYMGYFLFLKPLLAKSRDKKKGKGVRI
jgi:hypothetical protein